MVNGHKFHLKVARYRPYMLGTHAPYKSFEPHFSSNASNAMYGWIFVHATLILWGGGKIVTAFPGEISSNQKTNLLDKIPHCTVK